MQTTRPQHLEQRHKHQRIVQRHGHLHVPKVPGALVTVQPTRPTLFPRVHRPKRRIVQPPNHRILQIIKDDRRRDLLDTDPFNLQRGKKEKKRVRWLPLVRSGRQDLRSRSAPHGRLDRHTAVSHTSDAEKKPNVSARICAVVISLECNALDSAMVSYQPVTHARRHAPFTPISRALWNSQPELAHMHVVLHARPVEQRLTHSRRTETKFS